jgi:CDGSH-type Zn-finger protein/uncharacterized Fe-S cluster protein YjdI
MEEIRGKLAVIRFDGKKCIHARNCVLTRPDVFVPNVEGEWIYPDRATPDALMALAQNCPSGAIQVERLDGVEPEAAPRVNTIAVRENGPLAIRAHLVIEGHEDAPSTRATLCRCGQSKNKPYCDGSHTAEGFSATGEPPTRESAALESRDGEVRISPRLHGPLKVIGNLEMTSGTGRTIARAKELFLCRCGASANKPYCDGSHNRIGWKSE